MSGAVRGAVVRAPINSNDRPNAGHREWKRRDVTNEMRMLNHEMQYRSGRRGKWHMRCRANRVCALAHVLTAVLKWQQELEQLTPMPMDERALHDHRGVTSRSVRAHFRELDS